MDTSPIQDLYRRCRQVRELVLTLHYGAKSGHVGSALSCCEILSFIQFHLKKNRDEIVLSKGHAATALYSTLAVAGEIDKSALVESYYRDGTNFAAHPPPGKLPGIRFGTGSLGHGPGLTVGLALANKLSKDNATVYCVMSDGELNEGSVWEAFMFASHNKLTNTLFFIDCNGIQGFGRTQEVLNMGNLAEKLTSFGLQVRVASGHSFESLLDAHLSLKEACTVNSSPGVIIAETIKGFGLGELANTVDCHYLPLSNAQYSEAIDRLHKDYPYF